MELGTHVEYDTPYRTAAWCAQMREAGAVVAADVVGTWRALFRTIEHWCFLAGIAAAVGVTACLLAVE